MVMWGSGRHTQAIFVAATGSVRRSKRLWNSSVESQYPTPAFGQKQTFRIGLTDHGNANGRTDAMTF